MAVGWMMPYSCRVFLWLNLSMQLVTSQHIGRSTSTASGLSIDTSMAPNYDVHEPECNELMPEARAHGLQSIFGEAEGSAFATDIRHLS